MTEARRGTGRDGRASSTTRIRVALLIRSLNRGGAERQLAELATGLDAHGFEVLVLTFYPGGPIWEELDAHPSVRLESLDKHGRWEVARLSWRLLRSLRRWKPAILHSYLVEPSLFGLAVGRLARVPRVVWGVRASNVDYSKYDAASRMTFRSAAVFSKFADLIVANSESGRLYHVAHGYRRDSFIMIPNGIDTGRFHPSPEARARTRAWLGVRPDELLVGVSARLDPMKDHSTLLLAAQRVIREHVNTRIVCCGSGPASYLERLRTLARNLDIADRVHWMGEHGRMERIYPSFDVVCSPSSFGEGFSNSVGEAMSCGVPCVVTDVGDSARIVGDTGLVVRPGDSEALAEAILHLARLAASERAALGYRARRRIEAGYRSSLMVTRTAAAYRALTCSEGERFQDAVHGPS